MKSNYPVHLLLFSIFLFVSCDMNQNEKAIDQENNNHNMNENSAIIETQMLIRKPVNDVFQAFIDPNVTTNFWFTKSSGSMIAGQKVKWEWEMYNASAEVDVIEIVDNQKIHFEWGDPATSVEITFTQVSESATYVIIKNYGFKATGDELIAVIKDGTGGFTTVLDGLKAYLEHGIKLNLIGDKFPREITQHGN